MSISRIFALLWIIITEYGGQCYNSDWDKNLTSDWRQMEDVFRDGGCYRGQFLCQDRVNESLLDPSEMDPVFFENTACFCDADCWKYKDCCVDVTPPWPSTEDDIRWKCVSLPGSPEHIYMIGSCPSDWSDPKDIQLCERTVPDQEYSYMLDIPVHSNHTHNTYANVYCAKCHHDVHLSSFHIKLKCPKIDLAECRDLLHNASYMIGELRWLVYARGQYMGSSVYLSVSEFEDWDRLKKSHKVRRCRPVVESCTNTNYQEYMENCTSHYASYIVSGIVPQELVYKNIYCSLCNNVSLASSVQCCDGVGLAYLHMVHPRDNYGLPNCSYMDYDDLMGGGSIRHGGYSFSLVIDFHDRLGADEIGLGFRCKRGEIHDPVNDMCVPFMCGKHSIKADGECANNGFNNAENRTFTSQSCRMILIKKDETTVLRENNSIYINKTGQIYESSDFQEHDNDTFLVCLSSYLNVEKFSPIQSRISQAMLGISLICLVAHITNVFVTKLHTLPGKNMISLSISLFLAQGLFLFGSSSAVDNIILCKIIAIMTHFFFLASFFWMNVIAFDMYRTFTQAKSPCVTSHHKTFWSYFAYACLTSLAILLMAVITDYTDIIPGSQPGYGIRICWLSNRQGLLIFFAIPLAVLLLANIVFFLVTAYIIHHTVKITQAVMQTKKERVYFLLYIKLALIMGLTWVVGYIAAVVEFDPLWYVFIVLNASQGAFIFIAFSLKRKLVCSVIERIKGRITNTGSICLSSCTKTTANQTSSLPSSENVCNPSCSSSSQVLTTSQ